MIVIDGIAPYLTGFGSAISTSAGFLKSAILSFAGFFQPVRACMLTPAFLIPAAAVITLVAGFYAIKALKLHFTPHHAPHNFGAHQPYNPPHQYGAQHYYAPQNNYGAQYNFGAQPHRNNRVPNYVVPPPAHPAAVNIAPIQEPYLFPPVNNVPKAPDETKALLADVLVNLPEAFAQYIKSFALKLSYTAQLETHISAVDVEIPEELACPISLELMNIPVKINGQANEQAFDYNELISNVYVDKDGNCRHPITQLTFKPTDIAPAPEVAQKIEDYLKKFDKTKNADVTQDLAQEPSRTLLINHDSLRSSPRADEGQAMIDQPNPNSEENRLKL